MSSCKFWFWFFEILFTWALQIHTHFSLCIISCTAVTTRHWSRIVTFTFSDLASFTTSLGTRTPYIPVTPVAMDYNILEIIIATSWNLNFADENIHRLRMFFNSPFVATLLLKTYEDLQIWFSNRLSASFGQLINWM